MNDNESAFDMRFNNFNDNYSRNGEKRKQCSIKHYYQPKDLTSDMKEFLHDGLKLLSQQGILSEFDCEVFYLHEVEKIKQKEIAELRKSTVDKVKKVTPKVRKILAKNSDIVKYIFFMAKQRHTEGEVQDNDEIISKQADEITVEKYGKDPIQNAYNAERKCWNKLFDEYSQEQNNSNLPDEDQIECMAAVLKKVNDNPTYKTLLKKIEKIEESAEYIDWCKKNGEIYDCLWAKKLGCTVEEMKARRHEQLLFDEKVSDHYNTYKDNEDVLFNLWGYMQIYWLKLGRNWIE